MSKIKMFVFASSIAMLVFAFWFLLHIDYKWPVESKVSLLTHAAFNMEANTGCAPTSIKSLNDRFFQMKPKSNTCRKKIPASFTEIYVSPTESTRVSSGSKRFALHESTPMLVSIGQNPLDKKSFGVIISNLNKKGMKTFTKKYQKRNPVPFNGDNLFLSF